MPKITNTHSKTPIGLPDGTVIAPGESVDVDSAKWDGEKDKPGYKARANIAYYLEHGTLATGDKAAKAAEKAKDDDDAPAQQASGGPPPAPPKGR